MYSFFQERVSLKDAAEDISSAFSVFQFKSGKILKFVKLINTLSVELSDDALDYVSTFSIHRHNLYQNIMEFKVTVITNFIDTTEVVVGAWVFDILLISRENLALPQLHVLVDIYWKHLD